MRIGVAIAAMAVFLAMAGTAEAFKWHLGYGQAKNATKVFARETCRGERKCIAYAVGPCKRISESRVRLRGGTPIQGCRRTG